MEHSTIWPSWILNFLDWSSPSLVPFNWVRDPTQLPIFVELGSVETFLQNGKTPMWLFVHLPFFRVPAQSMTYEWIWTNKVSKRVQSVTGMPFVDLVEVRNPQGNKWHQHPFKMGRHCHFRNREKNLNCFNSKTTKRINVKFRQRLWTIKAPSWLVQHVQIKPNIADALSAAILKIGRIAMTQPSVARFWWNLARRCDTGPERRPCDL